MPRMTFRAILVVVALAGAAWGHPPASEGIRQVTERLEAAGPDAALLIERAELHRVSRHWDDARADAERALAMQPGMAEARLCLARVALERGDAAGAETLAHAYLGQRADAAGWRVLAAATAALGRRDDAAAAWTQVLETADPPIPDDYLEAAWLQARHAPQDPHAAIAILDAGVARLGPLVTLRAEAAAMARDAGMLDTALARVDALLAELPGSPGWTAERGRLLDAMGRRPEAWVAFSEAIAALEALPEHRRAVPVNRALAVELTERLRSPEGGSP
jgi:tetratricopeptide (TPR) repeat protein